MLLVVVTAGFGLKIGRYLSEPGMGPSAAEAEVVALFASEGWRVVPHDGVEERESLSILFEKPGCPRPVHVLLAADAGTGAKAGRPFVEIGAVEVSPEGSCRSPLFDAAADADN
ncbi:MAG: hypothetical protein R3D33_07010 [Hyphomicrobiaceae bacterium]